MVSKRLNIISLLSIPAFISHGIEEYLNDFAHTYPNLNFTWAENLFKNIPQASFGTFQIMWWLLLIVSLVLISSKKSHRIFYFLLGLIFLYELTHILTTFWALSYTPGFITSLLFIPISYFYWKELLSGRS